MFIRFSPSVSRFNLSRLYPHFIPHPPPISEPAPLHHIPTNLFSTSPDSNKASDSKPESPYLPGWLKSSEKSKLFYTESDDDFEIPQISDWAQYQKSATDAAKAVVVVDQVDRDADEISKVLKFRYNSPDAVAEALGKFGKCFGIEVSEDLVLKLLNRFGNDYASAFGIFKWARTRCGNGNVISETVCNQMVDILGKCKKFMQMWELVDEMNRVGSGLVTLRTMTMVIRRLARSGKYNKAIEAFGSLEKFGVNRDVEALNELLNSLVKEGCVESASVVFLNFKNEIKPTRHTYNIMIHGWCKARKLDEANKVLKEMEASGILPDTVTYTSFIEAYCKNKDFRNVEEMLAEMREKGCRPNVITYTIYIHALGKSRQISKAFEVFEMIKTDGCTPDSSLFNSLIFQLGKSGRLDDAIDLYKDMLKRDIKPNVYTYSTLISMYCQNSRVGDALKLLLEMEKYSVKPDLKTYDPLLKACCRKKQMKVLAFLLNNMFKNDISPELSTYTLLVNELCKVERLEHACLFFEEMILTGFTPRKSTYQDLMKLLEKNNMGKAKEHISMMYSTKKDKVPDSTVKTIEALDV